MNAVIEIDGVKYDNVVLRIGRELTPAYALNGVLIAHYYKGLTTYSIRKRDGAIILETHKEPTVVVDGNTVTYSWQSENERGVDSPSPIHSTVTQTCASTVKPLAHIAA